MEGDAHVLVFVEFTHEVKILQVDAHEAGIACAEYTIEHEFGKGDVGSFASLVALVIDTITTSSPSDTFGVWLFGSVGADNTNVCRSFVFRDLIFVDEVHGVGSDWHR